MPRRSSSAPMRPSGPSGAASARRGQSPPLPIAATLPQSVPSRRRGTGARRGADRSKPATLAATLAPSPRSRSVAEASATSSVLAAKEHERYNPGPPLHLQILPDDLLVEILMRFPPEPIYLFRASHVCKHWHGLIHDARFLRRFREFHGGVPPVLGFFTNQMSCPLFVPIIDTFTVSTTGKMSHNHWQVLDCRHGRVLLEFGRREELLVWDLVTGDTIFLPYPRQFPKQARYNGAVLCVAGHADCHSCPVLVALVLSNTVDFITTGCVYSSVTGVWGEITSIHIPGSFVDKMPTALVGNTLYWLLNNDRIIEFDLDKHRLDLVEQVPYRYNKQVLIMPTEDGILGFAGVDGSSLHLWSRVADIDGVVSWARKVIDLEKFLGPMSFLALLRGYAEDADVIFIDVYPDIHMIHLKSMTKIELSNKKGFGSIFPYASFYAPAKSLGTYCVAAEPSSSSAPSRANTLSRMPGSDSTTLAGARPHRGNALRAGERPPWR